MNYNLTDIKRDMEILKKQIEELFKSVQQQSKDSKQDLEPIAAKIINDIKQEIAECPCKKENKKQKEIYSYPNDLVGNEELGSSGNPNAFKWPKDALKK